MEKMDRFFLGYASDILADTNKGLSGSKIIEYSNRFAVDYDRKIELTSYPVPGNVSKRNILFANLDCFSIEEQVYIIDSLCSLNEFKNNDDVKDLKVRLAQKYGEYLDYDSLNEELISEARNWLSDYPESLKLYETAIEKYKSKRYERNVLDDIRLSFELLLKRLLDNNKSLDNQLNEIGIYLKERNISSKVRNMLVTIIDYFNKYQNEYVKHNDKVNLLEIEYIIEQATILMKLLIKVSK